MKTLSTILSPLLVAFVLISSVSHSISFHLCGGEIEDVAFFGHAQACTQHDDACGKDAKGNNHVSNDDDCCKDTTVLIDSDKYIPKITEKITLESFENISLPFVGVVQEDNSLDGLAHTNFTHYKPPLIERDIALLVQTFLI